MRPIASRALVTIALALSQTFPSTTIAQPSGGPDASLRLAQLHLAENGDVRGWEVTGLEADSTELIDSEPLLRLSVSFAGQDVSDKIVWEQLQRDGENFPEFVGKVAPGVEIRRTYEPAIDSGAVIHEIRLVTATDTSPGALLVTLRVLPSLRKHAPGGGSLGGVLYGYSRLFSKSPSSSGFQVVSEASEGSTAALAVRHVAIAVSSASQDHPFFTADPESGISVSLASRPGTTTFRELLEPLVLRGKALKDTDYANFLYPALWRPLQVLARAIEWTLEGLTAAVRSPGLAVVIFAILLRIALAPLSIWSIRQQRRFSAAQAAMKPAIELINRNYKGAEKSERILQTYKEHGFSPFSGLKGSTALFLQLPILIAFFAVTTESALFRDAPFLWATDLSMPDRVIGLPFSIPGLGADLNLLPIVLGVVSLTAALIHKRVHATASSRPGLLLALLFVVLFYSCAAALVLYWLIVNAAQLIETLYAGVREREAA